jgi:hypothetical protein
VRPLPQRPVAAALLAALVTVTALAGCSQDSGSEEAFCTEVAKVPALESVLSRFSETDGGLLQDRIDKARAAYTALGEAAPADIADATDDVVALVDEILTAVEAHPDDPTAASDQLRDAMADHPSISTHRAELASYAEETCGVQLDATLSGPGTSSTSTSTTGSSGTSSTSTTAPG